MAVHQAIDLVHETPGTLNALLTPFKILFRWSSKECVKTPGIGAEALRHLECADDVAFGFGHGGAAFGHHALREQTGCRLAVLDQAKVTHNLAPEARV